MLNLEIGDSVYLFRSNWAKNKFDLIEATVTLNPRVIVENLDDPYQGYIAEHNGRVFYCQYPEPELGQLSDLADYVFTDTESGDSWVELNRVYRIQSRRLTCDASDERAETTLQHLDCLAAQHGLRLTPYEVVFPRGTNRTFYKYAKQESTHG
jgi:hypothetical protein